MKKFCTKCGKSFESIGREVICPSCKAQAAADAKRAAVERAKMRSYTGEACPVRISGRASTVIREYGKAHSLPFAQALDDLLKASDYFKGTGSKWEDVEPYRSRRRDKHATETAQDAPQASKPHAAKAAKTVKQAASKAAKTSKTSKTAKEVKA